MMLVQSIASSYLFPSIDSRLPNISISRRHPVLTIVRNFVTLLVSIVSSRRLHELLNVSKHFNALYPLLGRCHPLICRLNFTKCVYCTEGQQRSKFGILLRKPVDCHCAVAENLCCILVNYSQLLELTAVLLVKQYVLLFVCHTFCI